MKHTLTWSFLALVGCSAGGGTLSVSTLTPARGSARGGQTITIAGSGFGAGTTVSFRGQAAKVSTVASDQLTVVTPRLPAGPALVEVKTDSQQVRLDGGFVYEALPLAFVDSAAQSLPNLPVDGAAVKLADADGDGDLDVFQAGRAEGLFIYENHGNATFVAPRRVAMAAPDGGSDFPARDVVVADFDGDGRNDVFVGTTGHAPSQLLLNVGPMAYSSAAVPGLFGVDQTALALDLDGDGDLDLISMGGSPTIDGAAQVQVLFNDGHGTFTDVTGQRLPGKAFDSPGAAAGDLDGDGKLDLFFAGATESSRLYLGDGHGSFARSAPDALPIDGAPHAGVPALGDLDGDGTLDIFLPTATQDRVLFNDGTAHFDDVSTIFLGVENGPSTRALLRDLDLDGHLDVVVVDDPGRVRLYRNDGSGRLFDYSAELVGNDAARLTADVAIGDLDGDGDDDLFVSRPGFSRPALFLNWAPTPTSGTLQDSDGDRYPDALDNCPTVSNPGQAIKAALPFGFSSAAAAAAGSGCELGALGASAYLFCRDTPASWPAAQATCKSLGGNLVTIDDAAEDAYLAAHSGAQAWIGLTDQVTENTFVWASGEPVGFLDWSPTQPDNFTNEDCVVLFANSLWNDDKCDVVKGYVCETDRSPMAPAMGDACAPDGGPADGGSADGGM